MLSKKFLIGFTIYISVLLITVITIGYFYSDYQMSKLNDPYLNPDEFYFDLNVKVDGIFEEKVHNRKLYFIRLINLNDTNLVAKFPIPKHTIKHYHKNDTLYYDFIEKEYFVKQN